jgi:predicted NAD/FAD-binding protein
MSFSVSRRGGGLEYAGTSLNTLFAQRRNLLSAAFWSMLADLRRFYRHAPTELRDGALSSETLGAFLNRRGYGAAFRDDHLLPMAAAIWSSPAATMLECPAQAFVRFFDNHGLLKLRARPEWRTVVGGSQAYVEQLTRRFAGSIRTNSRVVGLVRGAHGVTVADQNGASSDFDHVVIATHADQALSLLRDPSAHERRLLGSFRYTQNRAVLHSDASFMPRRRAVWSSWNYLDGGARDWGGAQITYWMNRLQSLPGDRPLFVTLNPQREPRQAIHDEIYAHPTFDVAAVAAQRALWSIQGKLRTWFCGAYFGAGFHEDGLQAGLAVAEDLGGVRRPWKVDGDSNRITRTKLSPAASRLELT